MRAMLLRRKKLLLIFLLVSFALCAFQFNDKYQFELVKKIRTYSLKETKNLFCLIIVSEEKLKKALEFFPIWTSRCDNHTFITMITENTFPQAVKGIQENSLFY